MTIEAWRPIPSAPGYEASSQGRVRRVAPTNTNGRGPGVLPGTVTAQSYVVHTLYVDSRRRQWKQHRLVCEAFHGPAPAGRESVAHGNGDPADNRPDNLRWATVSENHLDKREHGTATHVRGRRHGMARLEPDTVRAIRYDHARSGASQRTLAARYGTTPGNISNIVRRKSWQHLA